MVGGVRIEIAGRLVGEQHPRRVGDGAGDRDALLLAAGQFGRPMGDAVGEAEIGQDFLGARRPSRTRFRPRIICGSMTFSSAVNSGSSRCDW